MKKMLFGLIATVMISSASLGQTVTAETQKNLVNTQMVSIVNGAKAFFTKGQSYDAFLDAMLIPSPTVPTQDEFFKKVYEYVSNNTDDCDILKSDNSVLSRFVIDLSKSPKNQGSSADLFGKKKWWQNLIEAVANIALDILVPTNDTIIVIWEP
ncbi:hypothetical protein [Flavobacterium sp.]|uniref:hypothetical protein n=1 Tax=Flavobacterium sp. TaxID=239 RepID=UPI002B4AC88D|nr:hypothetical protein [Flavobacterium sp.]HLF51023.1 hypothetical protein [Flavobacterium sp.]